LSKVVGQNVVEALGDVRLVITETTAGSIGDCLLEHLATAVANCDNKLVGILG